MSRLLDGLSNEQKFGMNYLMSTWEDGTKATNIEVFNVGLKIIEDLASGDIKMAAAASAVVKKQENGKTNDNEYHKHATVYHK